MSRCYGCREDGPFLRRGNVSVYDQDKEVEVVRQRVRFTLEDVFVVGLFIVPVFYWLVTTPQ